MGSGGEAHDQELRGGIAEAWQRTPPIVLSAKTANPLLGHALPIGHESRTPSANHDRRWRQ
jgi:hypothetical protein